MGDNVGPPPPELAAPPLVLKWFSTFSSFDEISGFDAFNLGNVAEGSGVFWGKGRKVSMEKFCVHG